MPKKIAFSVSLLLIVVFVVLMLSRENIDFNNLSVEQLSKAGYYAYILPHEVQEEMNLTLRNIEMISFDFHCKSGDSNHDYYNWNYVSVDYYSGAVENPTKYFTTRTTPADALFDSRNAVPVSIDTVPLAYHYEIERDQIKFVDDLA